MSLEHEKWDYVCLISMDCGRNLPESPRWLYFGVRRRKLKTSWRIFAVRNGKAEFQWSSGGPSAAAHPALGFSSWSHIPYCAGGLWCSCMCGEYFIGVCNIFQKLYLDFNLTVLCQRSVHFNVLILCVCVYVCV